MIVFCLHFLGGSSREWARVAAAVSRARCVALDLPGFGKAADEPGYSVAEMAAYVGRAIRAHAPARWMIAGHSMGAKVAAAIAREIEDGTLDLSGFVGLVLLAGSPPSPEPMGDEQRQKMLGWFEGDAASDRSDAVEYVSSNSERLDAAAIELAVTDVLRARRAAWRAWLESGSREDWSARIGTLQAPTLVLAGEKDEALGPSAQRELMVPHFANVRAMTIAGVKHLLPLESADEVARAIDDHVASIDYRALIRSNRVGRKTRDALLGRDVVDDPDYVPVELDVRELRTLRAVLERVIPQEHGTRIDLASRIDGELASGKGDGWRFAILPPDAQAYRAGLLTLRDEARRAYACEFFDLDGTRADDMLTRVADGRFEVESDDRASLRLDADQMKAWFEDVRSDAVKTYVGHPDTLARIGYSGIANGGDGRPKTGFVRIGPDEREGWEPIGAADLAR